MDRVTNSDAPLYENARIYDMKALDLVVGQSQGNGEEIRTTSE